MNSAREQTKKAFVIIIILDNQHPIVVFVLVLYRYPTRDLLGTTKARSYGAGSYYLHNYSNDLNAEKNPSPAVT